MSLNPNEMFEKMFFENSEEERIEIRKPDGKVIRGVIFRPGGTSGIFPAVIFSHGFGACYQELIHHGKEYAENGIVCTFFDFCGGGLNSESDGSMLEMTVFTEAEDLEAVMNRVLELPYVDKEELYLQGESQGGLVSAIVAERREKDVRGLILWYPAFVIPEDAEKRIKAGVHTALGLEISPEYDQAAISIKPESLQRGYNQPVLLIHGDRDDCVPMRYSELATENYPFADLEVIKGAGHGFEGSDSERARKMSIQFIKTHSYPENTGNS